MPLKMALFGNCGGATCGVEAMTCAASPTLPNSSPDGKSPKGCCVPFQCCFPCCCYCQQPAQLPNFAEAKKNTRPSETTKTLLSNCLGEHFQPPEFAQHS